VIFMDGSRVKSTIRSYTTAKGHYFYYYLPRDYKKSGNFCR